MYTWNPTMSVIKNGRKVYTRQGGRWTRDLPYNITQFFSSVFPAAGESYSSFRRGTSIPLWAFFPPSRYTGTHMHVLASKESRRVSKAYGREKKKQFNSKKKKTPRIHTRFPPLFCSTDLSKRAVPRPWRADLVIRFAGTFRVVFYNERPSCPRQKRSQTAVFVWTPSPSLPASGGYVLRFVRVRN